MGQQLILDIQKKLIVDLFAGGGGMSTAFEMAFGRSPDIAINHNNDALSMHRANHPQTRHFIADVFEVCPRGATQGRPVGWLHLSPDCTHHSQAAGGQPRSKKIRGLAWVGYRWAGTVLPDVISLENVKQILQWGPLVAKRDKATGRVLTLDTLTCPTTGKKISRVAAPGEQVPLSRQFLVPDPQRAGQTWRHFVRSLEGLGYQVEHKVLCAADLGGHTTRERLFMISRRDGQPIRWPEQTHFPKATCKKLKLPKSKQWKPAADCLDFSLPCPSIFTRAKPLADATLRRIARGVVKYVLEAGEPFIVPLTHQGSDRGRSIDEPLPTITAAHRGELAVAAPVIVQAGHGDGKPDARRWSYGAKDVAEPLGTVTASAGGHALATAMLVQTGYGEREGQAARVLDIAQPLGTVVGTGKHALTSAYLMQANGGFNTVVGRDLAEPMSTVTNTGSQQQLVTAHLTTLRKDCIGVGADEPVPTITAGAEHHGVVECALSQENEDGALRVAAFLMRYYGEGGQWSGLADPMTTITTKDRMALVTVVIQGTPSVVVDIGLRMLQPPELYLANDFPRGYRITHGHDGRAFSKSAQVRMVGNSVDPIMAEGFLRANAPELAVRKVA